MKAIFFLICVATLANAVRITRLLVPLGASHDAPLDCKYDLEDDKLYDVKWYKDGQQFFRCMPNGQVQEFQVDGLKLEYSPYAHVGSCPLNLIHLEAKSAGEYKCEVTTEGPAFKTASESRRFRLIAPSRRTQFPITTTTEEIEIEDAQEEKIADLAESKLNSKSASTRNTLFITLLIFVVNIYVFQ